MPCQEHDHSDLAAETDKSDNLPEWLGLLFFLVVAGKPIGLPSLVQMINATCDSLSIISAHATNRLQAAMAHVYDSSSLRLSGMLFERSVGNRWKHNRNIT